jgi:hypothetical protein
MQFGKLKSIGHNIAHSLASGIGLMIGTYEMDIFGEAKSSNEGFINVDFLNATATGGAISTGLAKAILLYRDALPSMCAKHGLEFGVIKTLQVRYAVDPVYGRHFTVKIESISGKSAVDRYAGFSGERLRKRHK